MQVKTFVEDTEVALDEQINRFFDSWNMASGCTYHLIDVRFACTYKPITNQTIFSAMVIYNRQDTAHTTF